MATFALVSEGITDQLILQHIIYAVVEDDHDEEVHFSILQPLRDATDQSRQEPESFGGWEKVLEYCTKTNELIEALSVNQYLVIQIDTDFCEHPNFGLSLHDNGRELTPLELALTTKNKLIELMTWEFYDAHKDRIIFAITVHSSECWLLPFYGTTASARCKTKSCESTLNRDLTKQDIKYAKDGPCYEKICKPLSKAKLLKRARKLNGNLDDFVESIESLAPYDYDIHK